MYLDNLKLVDDYRASVETWFRVSALRDGICLPEMLEWSLNKQRISTKSNWYILFMRSDLSILAHVRDYRIGICKSYSLKI